MYILPAFYVFILLHLNMYNNNNNCTSIFLTADDKPNLSDLLHMSYTGDDGRDVHFRLMDQVKPHWRRLAIALKFPQYEIAVIESKDDPVYYLLTEWLRGGTMENDTRPLTWRTLIASLRHANLQEEATVLDSWFQTTSRAHSDDMSAHTSNNQSTDKHVHALSWVTTMSIGCMQV